MMGVYQLVLDALMCNPRDPEPPRVRRLIQEWTEPDAASVVQALVANGYLSEDTLAQIPGHVKSRLETCDPPRMPKAP